MIFRYHSGFQAIEYVDAIDPRMHVLFQTKAVRAAGWRGNDDDFARSLPRSDYRPPLVAPPSMMQVIKSNRRR